MKRLHVHLGVDDLAESIRFYSTVFAADPIVKKADYAKWMLDDPLVNFAISQGRGDRGIHHLGIQAENAAELAELHDRLTSAERPVIEEAFTVCCYAKSKKTWISDPQGLAWESFLTRGESTVYGGDGPAIGSNPGGSGRRAAGAKSCCDPSGDAE